MSLYAIGDLHLHFQTELNRVPRGQFCTKGIECIFELNPGNRSQDPEHRIAKGIAWIVLDTDKGDHLL